uniref:Uncharacterized protein n=1 Tax=Timema cristinae TaxID=61476 RepID=A0A7R9HCP3_TIMCR|nr:unnamed protein product [Timema cristinae]
MSRDPESCPGVIRPVASKVASGQLKFGMERILSGEISTTQHEHTELPCSECVSSLLRCCQLSSPANNVANNGVESNETYYSGYYTTLHNPRPVRPYTNRE